MLEPSDSTERVRDIVAHFDDLTKAHDAVKRAREQLEALEPVATTTATSTTRHSRERDSLESERAAVRLFIAELRSSLLAAEIDRLNTDGERLWAEQDEVKEQQRILSEQREALIEERAEGRRGPNRRVGTPCQRGTSTGR